MKNIAGMIGINAYGIITQAKNSFAEELLPQG
jgi:hypothetical protein